MRVGGNIAAEIQTKTTAKNAIGEYEKSWTNVQTLTGWLDYTGGDAKYTYDAKIQESTHVFICDYVQLNGITAENSRLIINDEIYDILMIDNPMGLNKHLEITLKYTGGQ